LVVKTTLADLPDSIDYSTINCVIAWEMVKISIEGEPSFSSQSIDDQMKKLTELYGVAY